MTPPHPPDVGPAPDFFDDAYYRLLEPFQTEEDARFETGALRELIGLAQDETVLDLGCGWGRHLALLAAAGHDIVGVDRSLALLRKARTTLDAGPHHHIGALAARGSALVAGDMRRLPLADRTFDVVLNLATSLGLFLDDHDATRSLAEARRVLRPGGRLLLEGMHREDVEPDFAERDRWSLDDGTEVRVRRRFDPRRGISHEVLRWDGPAGAGEKRHSLRVRSGDEWTALLERAGLGVRATYGDWGGGPFEAGAPRYIALAERPAAPT